MDRAADGIPYPGLRLGELAGPIQDTTSGFWGSHQPGLSTPRTKVTDKCKISTFSLQKKSVT